MTYSQTIQYLYDLQLFGLRLGLETTRTLAELAGSPHQGLRFIHVAGTNGKGSTCAMLESIYRAAGLRVGLFTSPHLVSFAERIQVNRQSIPESRVISLVSEMQRLLQHFSEETHPTFFEVVTIMGLRYFAEQQCDLVIWETGLGGRLDSTNIVTPLASLITNVQKDHEKHLGDTLSAIASEKAGIIKPGVPVITAANDPEALAVIARTAQENHCPLTVVTSDLTHRPPLDTLRLPLLGEHQKLNAALALATVKVLPIPVTPEQIRHGLETVQWAGRLQVVSPRPGQTVLLDGAHNPDGVLALRAALQRHFANQPFTLILGTLRDKDWETMCRLLAPLAASIILAPVESQRAAPPEILEGICRQANPGIPVETAPSLGAAWEKAQSSTFVVMTGSLHFIGQALELLHVSPLPPQNERNLNEYR